ncbi:ArsR family transcriptional regulator [Geoglobus acetivorans]|uniref:Winged helix-turn-helix domain-containing protein n=1 Tax=Geoglobus acetivorans TaxID=565033 RepID=A0ABZ3H2A8_GEOAI|nr:winged helix-turn-helix transcriptional regulator [Geoglobus acetivorans]
MKFEEWTKSEDPEKAEELRRRFKMAINNPIRRKILTELYGGSRRAHELADKLGVEEKLLKYHLDILTKGSCIEFREDRIYLTEEGRVLTELILSRG